MQHFLGIIMTINESSWSIPELQQRLDAEAHRGFETYNKRTAQVAEVVNALQKVSLDLMRSDSSNTLDAIEGKYSDALTKVKPLLPHCSADVTPILLDKSNPKESAEKIQNQMEYLQLLSNNEQTKETNLLDLSLKNYTAVTQTLSEIAKTLFGFIKHVLNNSTGR